MNIFKNNEKNSSDTNNNEGFFDNIKKAITENDIMNNLKDTTEIQKENVEKKNK